MFIHLPDYDELIACPMIFSVACYWSKLQVKCMYVMSYMTSCSYVSSYGVCVFLLHGCCVLSHTLLAAWKMYCD